jgi:hypothetical protein
MKLSIEMPTVDGREDELQKSLAAYQNRTPLEIEWIIEENHPTCGAAWNAGAAKATGDVLHMAADDIEPTDGWWEAAWSALSIDRIPLGWIYEHDSKFGRDFPRIVICMTEWWQDIDPRMHYWTDNLFGDLMREAGHHYLIVPGFDFLHRRSLVKRGAGMTEAQRMRFDHDLYRDHGIQRLEDRERSKGSIWATTDPDRRPERYTI